MTLNLSFDEVLRTTRSVRKRLDPDKPVPRSVLTECLELALQAPTAANAQDWQWLFIADPAKRAALGDIYRDNLSLPLHLPAPSYAEDDVRTERMEAVNASGWHLAQHIQDAPLLLIPCLRGRVDNAPSGQSASFWASILPAAWSFCLALRSRGLGTCWTTLHLLGQGERRAAEVLDIPYDQYSQGGLFPIAYTKGTNFRPAKRLPAEQVMHWDNW